MSWEEVQLGDLGEVVTGKTPATKQPDFYGGEYMFVTPSDLDFRNYYCRNTENTVTEKAQGAHKNQFIPPDSVMLTCIGNTIGKCAISSEYCLTNQQINSVLPKPSVNPHFLYYLLENQRDRIRGIGLGSGSAQPIINKTTFSKLRVSVPDLSIQNRSASILKPYDDLLENNRRRIQLLEESARLLYREWFVHLRFPGHEHVKVVDGVPEGWERKPLGEITELHYGKALKQQDRVEGPAPVFGSSGEVGTHEKWLVPGPGIVVGRKGTVGSVYWVDLDFWPIDTVYYVEPKEVSFTLYYALLHTPFVSSDAAVPGLNRKFAYSRPVLWPSGYLRDQFEEYVADISAQISNLKRQNKKLTEARDLLLPRLMNGEIAV